jgi:hypothetical protein
MVRDNNAIEKILKLKITERTFSGIPSPDMQDKVREKQVYKQRKSPQQSAL